MASNKTIFQNATIFSVWAALTMWSQGASALSKPTTGHHPHTQAEITEFTYESNSAEALFKDFAHPAKGFTARVADVKVVGLEIGPAHGDPVLLVGGYSTSFPYLRKLIHELTGQGYRVFVYNPPGQGLGDLESGRRASSSHLGVNGMLEVFSQMRRLVYELSGEKKVVVMGHSLGGFQVRMGSLGLIGTLAGHTHVNAAARAEARRQTALIVPLMSFGLLHDEVWDQAHSLDALVLRDLAPLLTACSSMVVCFIPEMTKVIAERAAAAYLGALQNSLHQGLFGVDRDHFDEKELNRLARYFFPHKISDQIRDDLSRWSREHKFTTSDGFDLGAAWEKQQQSAQAIPTLYVAAERDGITDVKPFVAEAEAIRRSRVLLQPVGHFGPFVSHTHAAEIAAAVAKTHAAVGRRTCERLLLADASNL